MIAPGQLLEPAAEVILEEFRELHGVGRTPNVRDSEVHAFSAAISAKRTADALEQIAHALSGQDAGGSILHWLENIASSANRGATG